MAKQINLNINPKEAKTTPKIKHKYKEFRFVSLSKNNFILFLHEIARGIIYRK
jgi:hypothetical protein